jgi:hypothetical protein
MTEPAPEDAGGYPSSALLGAPVAPGRCRQTPDRSRYLAGWNSGELPGQVAEQLASRPPGMPSADQPPAVALRRRAARRRAAPRTANPRDKRVLSCVLGCCKNHPA